LITTDGAEAMRRQCARRGIEQEMARKFARWEQLDQQRLKSG